MSKTVKRFVGHKRHISDGVVQEKDLYFRRDRRSSARKSEKDPTYEWTDMNMTRKVRRNDGWEKDIPSLDEVKGELHDGWDG